MPQTIITYAGNPNFALACTNAQAGATLTLQPLTGTPLSQLLWNVNRLNGYITLAASVVPNVLALATTSCASGTLITAQLRNGTDTKQQWNFLIGTSIINSIGCPGMCVDVQNRVVAAGTPIWLYPVNGSPAQQWNFEAVDAVDLAAAAELEAV